MGVAMNKKSLSSGYALLWGAIMLTLVSLLGMSALSFSKSRERLLESHLRLFDSELERQNEAILSEWGRQNETD